MSKDSMGAYKGTDRRTVLKAAGAGAAMASLAGCAGLVGEDSESGSLTVGHIGPESNVLGAGSIRAANMAVDRVNSGDDLDEAGVLGEDVNLVTGDTQANPSEAQTVVEELINQENVDVIVGAFASEVARTVIDLTAEFDVPYISTGPADPRLSTNFVGNDYEKNKHYFRAGPINSELQAQGMRDYCVYLSDRHSWNSLTFYRDNAAWTDVYGNQLPGLLNEEGLTIEASEAVTIEEPDLQPLVNETASSGADYMLRFFAHISNAPSQLLGPWLQGQLDFGVEGIHVPGMHPEYDIATEGICLYETTSQTGAGGAAPITENTLPFIEAYTDRFGSDGDLGTPDGSPMYMGFATYDAILLLQDVVNEVGSTDLSNNLDDYVDEMLSTEPGRIPEISGPIQFYGPDGDYPHDLKETRDADGSITNFPVTQWQPNEEDRPGKFECVFPGDFRTADHIKAPWLS